VAESPKDPVGRVQKKFQKTVDFAVGFWDSYRTHGKNKNKMRTKTAILTAAVVAAGALSSVAQNVYSLNVVGYVNVPLAHGYNLVASQLTGSDALLGTVFGTVTLPEGTAVLKWDGAHQRFFPGDTLYSAATTQTTAGWYDSSFAPSTTTVRPGEGVFLLNPGGTTNVTLVGQVTQGTNAVTLGAGYSFASTIPPISVDLGTNGPMALPAVTGLAYLYFDSSTQKYAGGYTYYDASITGAGQQGWYDSSFAKATLIPAVGQGFVMLNPGAALTWVNTFSVQ